MINPWLIVLGLLGFFSLTNQEQLSVRKRRRNRSKKKNNRKVKKMAKKVFYSFHFDNDVMRVQQVRNIGAIEENKPVSPQEWEQAKKTPNGIEDWIEKHMKDKSCVVVLIGKNTSERKWVDYEIRKAWKDKKGIFGIYIHNLNCPNNGKSAQGANPFDNISFTDGSKMSSVIQVYNPSSIDTYKDIAGNIEQWVDAAIKEAAKR